MRTSPVKRIVALQGAIVILLAAISNGIAQECRTSLDKHLVVAEKSLIWTVDSNGQSREAIATASYPVSLDYDYSSNTLYWSDWETREIFSLRDKSSKPHVVLASQKNWLPSGLAIDYVSGKLYYTESFSSTVRVADLKNNYQTIIVGTNLTEAKDIELDLHEGYIFVLDKYQIIRTELDGSNRKVIYSELGDVGELLDGIFTPMMRRSVEISRQKDPERVDTYQKSITIGDIVVNPREKRVYFVNTVSRRIESIDYDGNDRKIHFEDSNASEQFEGISNLAFIDDTLYYANRETKNVHTIDLAGNNHKMILEYVEPIAIKGISCFNQQNVNNVCENNNGGCEQLCLLSKSSKKNYRCACSIGYQLGKDGRTCISAQEFLLYSQENSLRGQTLATNGQPIVDVIDPTHFQLGQYSQLDYDAEDGLVFYTSSFPDNKLHKIRLDTSEQTIMTPDILSRDVASITYDWVTKNLYYFTYYYADVTTLSVVNVRNPTYSKVVIDSVHRLARDLVVHPNKGYLFIAQMYDNHAYISRLNTDGSDLTEIIKLDRTSVDALAIDYENDRLYWIEHEININGMLSHNVIRHSNLDGKDIQVVPIPKGFKDPRVLSIKGDYLYVVVGPHKSILRLDKKQDGKPIILAETSPSSDINDVKVFSKAIQTTRPDHPCSADHGCQKFCFALPSSNETLKRVCGCPYGEKLAANGKSCVDNSTEEPLFLPCKYTSFKCMMEKQQK